VADIAVPQEQALTLDVLTGDEATALLFATVPGITYREVAARLGEEPAVILRRLTSALRTLGASAASPALRPGVSWR